MLTFEVLSKHVQPVQLDWLLRIIFCTVNIQTVRVKGVFPLSKSLT